MLFQVITANNEKNIFRSRDAVHWQKRTTGVSNERAAPTFYEEGQTKRLGSGAS
jgi:hypothetical protein